MTKQDVIRILKAARPVEYKKNANGIGYLDGFSDGKMTGWEVTCEFFAREFAAMELPVDPVEDFINQCGCRE